MFQGAAPRELRSIIHEHAGGWNVDDVYVGCSGNFTIERTLRDVDRKTPFRLHGCDVSIYTCALGATQAGDEFPIRVKPEHHDEWGWLADWGKDRDDQAATILLASRMLDGFGRENAYYQRLRDAHRADWPQLHARTKEKYRARAVNLASFAAQDLVDFMAQAPKRSAFVSFPPFYKGGYETMFHGLTEVFDWTPPQYADLDEASIERVLKLAQDFDHWLIATNAKVPALGGFLRGTVQTALYGSREGLGARWWVYSSSGRKRVVGFQQKIEPIRAPRLTSTGELGDTLTLAPITAPEFKALRSVYLNPGIPPGYGLALPLAVAVDGRVIGAIGYELSGQTKHSQKLDAPAAHLFSDFAIGPTRYPRLSKLVVAAALSQEALALAQRFCNHRLRSVWTMAFTNRPNSMKYRGILDVVSRKDHGEEHPDHRFRYEVAYGAPAPRWTLEEAMAWWRAKHDV